VIDVSFLDPAPATKLMAEEPGKVIPNCHGLGT
jgi:hypothetical protein